MTKAPLVLIVEDDIWQAEHYVRTLAEMGIRTEVVTHAIAAIDSADAALPDAMILDVLLAGPNALALLHEFRSHPDLASIPIVLCTSIADQLPEKDVKAYGVCAVLDKTTMSPNDIVAVIKKVLP